MSSETVHVEGKWIKIYPDEKPVIFINLELLNSISFSECGPNPFFRKSKNNVTNWIIHLKTFAAKVNINDEVETIDGDFTDSGEHYIRYANKDEWLQTKTAIEEALKA